MNTQPTTLSIEWLRASAGDRSLSVNWAQRPPASNAPIRPYVPSNLSSYFSVVTDTTADLTSTYSNTIDSSNWINSFYSQPPTISSDFGANAPNQLSALHSDFSQGSDSPVSHSLDPTNRRVSFDLYSSSSLVGHRVHATRMESQQVSPHFQRQATNQRGRPRSTPVPFPPSPTLPAGSPLVPPSLNLPPSYFAAISGSASTTRSEVPSPFAGLSNTTTSAWKSGQNVLSQSAVPRLATSPTDVGAAQRPGPRSSAHRYRSPKVHSPIKTPSSSYGKGINYSASQLQHPATPTRTSTSQHENPLLTAAPSNSTAPTSRKRSCDGLDHDKSSSSNQISTPKRPKKTCTISYATPSPAGDSPSHRNRAPQTLHSPNSIPPLALGSVPAKTASTRKLARTRRPTSPSSRGPLMESTRVATESLEQCTRQRTFSASQDHLHFNPKRAKVAATSKGTPSSTFPKSRKRRTDSDDFIPESNTSSDHDKRIQTAKRARTDVLTYYPTPSHNEGTASPPIAPPLPLPVILPPPPRPLISEIVYPLNPLPLPSTALPYPIALPCPVLSNTSLTLEERLDRLNSTLHSPRYPSSDNVDYAPYHQDPVEGPQNLCLQTVEVPPPHHMSGNVKGEEIGAGEERNLPV